MLAKTILLALFVALPAVSGQNFNFESSIHSLTGEKTAEPFKPASKDGLRTSVSSINKAVYYASLAGATYCNDELLKSWNCAHCKTLGSDVTLQNILVHPDYETRAIVTTNDNRKEIVLSFRGSTNTANWIQNLSRDLVPFPVATNAAVHKGFKTVTEGLRPLFIEALRTLLADRKYRNYEVVVVGHSLGGAIATLASIFINQQLNFDWRRIQVYTYGVPRVGNPEFVAWYNQLPTSMTRVVNENDDVPHLLSMNSGYRHTFTELYINRGTTKVCSTYYLEDPNCSNSRVPFLSTEAHHKAWNVKLGSDYC